jgi:hypothetical protein
MRIVAEDQGYKLSEHGLVPRNGEGWSKNGRDATNLEDKACETEE